MAGRVSTTRTNRFECALYYKLARLKVVRDTLSSRLSPQASLPRNHRETVVGIQNIALVSESGHVTIRCLARGLYVATLARRGRPCCGEERSGRVARSGSKPWGAAYNGGDCTGTERLVMTPSIWLERTDARVGLQAEPRAVGIVGLM
jgi:hypothetical protein